MDLFIYTLRNVAGAIVTAPLALLLAALMIVLHLKNKKIVAMQKLILGGSVNSSIELTLSQLVLGILAGTIGSLILSSLGIVFNENSGMIILFFVSLLLAFIKPRLICFSYSGAILGIMSILMKFGSQFMPQYLTNTVLDIDILYLVTFIGVFHIIEGILVMIDGDRGAIPVFTSKNGNIIGGYALKRYWVLPIAIMMAVTMNSEIVNYNTEFIQNPNWWPIIKSPAGLALIGSGIISIFPFYTMLGYSSITFTRSKREKAVSSGVHILIYGIVLVLIAQASKFGIWSEILVVAFMPLAHEYMLKSQEKMEEKRSPRFVSDEEGLMILEMSPESKLKEFGVNIESKLLSVNNVNINSESEVYSILKENLYNAKLKIKDSKGIIHDIKYRHSRNSRLGVLLVPRNVSKEDVVPVNDGFKGVLNNLKNSESRVYGDENQGKK